MSLEHHKDLYDHWSDDEYDSLTDDEDFEDEELYEMDEDFIRAMRCRNKSHQKYYHTDPEFLRNNHDTTILLM